MREFVSSYLIQQCDMESNFSLDELFNNISKTSYSVFKSLENNFAEGVILEKGNDSLVRVMCVNAYGQEIDNFIIQNCLQTNPNLRYVLKTLQTEIPNLYDREVEVLYLAINFKEESGRAGIRIC